VDEIEVKILEIDVGAVVRRLEALGGAKVFDGLLTNSYFDYPSNRIAAQGRLLRLRTAGGRCQLTYKEPVSTDRAKVMREEEITLPMEDAARVTAILSGIGLVEKPQPSKRRVSYALGASHCEIDFYDGVPPFLEIEAPDIEQVYALVDRLGFSRDRALAWNTIDLLRHYGRI